MEGGSLRELVRKAAILVRGTSRGDEGAHPLPEYRRVELHRMAPNLGRVKQVGMVLEP
jgi:hypothetical protein